MSISFSGAPAEAVTPGPATWVGPASTANGPIGPGDPRAADPITSVGPGRPPESTGRPAAPPADTINASLVGAMDPAEVSAEAGGAAGRGPTGEDTGSPGNADAEDPAEPKGADPTAGASDRRGPRRAAPEGEDPGPDRLLDRGRRGLLGRTQRASALGQRPGPDRRPLRRRDLAPPGGGDEEGGGNPS